jgi:Transposase DDE domain
LHHRGAEENSGGFRTYGKSKDSRDDLPQIVIGMAVTREGIPVRVWCWPGNTGDQALIRQVRDDMRDWTLSKIVWVADRGFSSERNRRYLRQGEGAYIIGEKLRSDSVEIKARRPVPVYLPLSSWDWAARRPGLDQWLVEQLNELYQIPRPLARRWTTGTQLLFLLDGLDEIPDRSDRIACVKAINQFTRFGRSARLPVVVASRPVEYDTLTVQLQLEAAIGVRPLDPTVVLDDLQHAPGMQAVASAVRGDPGLLELLRSPLLVSMLTLAYTGVPEAQIHAITGSPAERRHQLITDYVQRRFELNRRSGDGHQSRNTYPPERTRAWLSALALNLTQQQQTVFLPGRTQPEWLPNPWGRWAVIAAPGLIVGLIFGLSGWLIFGLSGGLGGRLSAGLGGLIFGLITGVCAGLGAGLVGHPQPAERLSWSWRRAQSKLGTSLFVGLLAGLIGLIFGPGGWLIGWLIFGLIFGLSGGLSKGLIPIYFTPYDGIRRSVRNGLMVALIVGLFVGLIFGLSDGLSDGLSVGLIFGLTFGLIAGLAFGLDAAMQHGIFRLLLWAHHIAPLRTVRWLNYMVQLRLLYRGTSGGYVFIHRIVQNYFCDAVVDLPSEDSAQTQS